MSKQVPRTPFATHLSGSAKETELRIRNIVQWKKKRPPVWLIIFTALILLGCGGLVSCQQRESASETTDAADFFAHYRADFDDEAYTGVRTFSSDGRTLVYEDGPENPVESLVAYQYYCETMAAYDELLAHMGSESLQLSARNTAKNAEDGLYFQQINLHQLAVLTQADFAPGGAYFTESEDAERFLTEVAEAAAENALTEYTVVYVDLSWQWSDAALAQGPQLGNGRYERLYLVGKTAQDDAWKLYECFWGEYALGRTVPVHLEEQVMTLLTDYFRGNGWNYDRVYFAGQEPGAPQEGDVRIDSVRYLDSEQTYETTGEAYAVTRSYYLTRQTGTEVSTGWEESSEIYVIMGRSMDGELDEVRGYTTPNTARSIHQQILEVSYGVMDLEVSLWRDGYPGPAGPAREIFFFREVNDGPEEIEVWDDPGHVLYNEGDYWAWHRWEGFTALCYHNAAEGRYYTNRIETTRTDLHTYRGIRVGDTRAKVLEAYPELHDTEYWSYEGDYLWYGNGDTGLGAGLIFYFENDVVCKIELNDMFN